MRPAGVGYIPNAHQKSLYQKSGSPARPCLRGELLPQFRGAGLLHCGAGYCVLDEGDLHPPPSSGIPSSPDRVPVSAQQQIRSFPAPGEAAAQKYGLIEKNG